MTQTRPRTAVAASGRGRPTGGEVVLDGLVQRVVFGEGGGRVHRAGAGQDEGARGQQREGEEKEGGDHNASGVG